MARRSNRKRSITNFRPVTKSINIPVGVRVPTVVYAPPVIPAASERRHNRVQLKSKGKTYRKRVTVMVPNQSIPFDQVSYLDRKNRIVHLSKRKSARLFDRELHRRRNEEQKARRRRRSRGTDQYFGTIRNDSTGIIGANASKRPSDIAFAAAIGHSIKGKRS